MFRKRRPSLAPLDEHLESCPTCGRKYDDAPVTAPFILSSSALIDEILIAQEALAHVRQAAEEGGTR
jgi:hypothetical protein